MEKKQLYAEKRMNFLISIKNFLDFLEKLASTGIHILLVTHHFDNIILPITHIAVMDSGRIISQGKRENFSSLFKKE